MSRPTYLHLDTLQPVEPKAILWGRPVAEHFVKTGWLSRTKQAGHVPYMQLGPGRCMAVRLVSSKGLEGKAARIAVLATRDGLTCLYCAQPLAVTECSPEHIVPLAAGGPDHVSNMALCCQPCNRAAGALGVVAKVRLAVRARLGEAAMLAGGGA